MSKVLLIEPDFLLAKTYKEHLVNSGYGVRTSSNVQKAVDDIDAEIPDLIILELQLAAHNGYEFLYELRSYIEWQSIPVIVHTMVPSHASGLSIELMKQLGIVEYLYKPTTSLFKLVYAIEHNVVVSTK